MQKGKTRGTASSIEWFCLYMWHMCVCRCVCWLMTKLLGSFHLSLLKVGVPHATMPSFSTAVVCL